MGEVNAVAAPHVRAPILPEEGIPEERWAPLKWFQDETARIWRLDNVFVRRRCNRLFAGRMP